jgi:hypothetical protein
MARRYSNRRFDFLAFPPVLYLFLNFNFSRFCIRFLSFSFLSTFFFLADRLTLGFSLALFIFILFRFSSRMLRFRLRKLGLSLPPFNPDPCMDESISMDIENPWIHGWHGWILAYFWAPWMGMDGFWNNFGLRKKKSLGR